MGTPSEALQECTVEQLRQFLQDTIRAFSRPEDTQSDAMQPVHGIHDSPQVVRVSFRRTNLPHGWGDVDNPITQALRAWADGDPTLMERVNQTLKEKLGVQIEPIATPNPQVDPHDSILTNLVVTGVHDAVQNTLDDLG